MRRVLRDSSLGLIIFLGLEALCFNTALYQQLLEPESAAGLIRLAVGAELEREPSGSREVLVVGDSRFVEGFSPTLANETVAGRDCRFVAIAINGSTLRSWYYLLRELDPDGDRYAAVVLPLYFIDDFEYYPDPQNWTWDLEMLPSLLRYSDTLDIVSSFDTGELRFDAFRCCALKGYALREDVQSLLRRPKRRIRHLREKEEVIDRPLTYEGRPHDLVGFRYDETREKLVFTGKSKSIPRADRKFIREELMRVPSASGSADYRERWLGRIAERYRGKARVILVRPPRGPVIVHEVPGPDPDSVARRLVAEGALRLIAESTFVDLEKPELFFDAKHLNAPGRRVFSVRLAEEVLAVVDAED